MIKVSINDFNNRDYKFNHQNLSGMSELIRSQEFKENPSILDRMYYWRMDTDHGGQEMICGLVIDRQKWNSYRVLSLGLSEIQFLWNKRIYLNIESKSLSKLLRIYTDVRKSVGSSVEFVDVLEELDLPPITSLILGAYMTFWDVYSFSDMPPEEYNDKLGLISIYTGGL